MLWLRIRPVVPVGKLGCKIVGIFFLFTKYIFLVIKLSHNRCAFVVGWYGLNSNRPKAVWENY